MDRRTELALSSMYYHFCLLCMFRPFIGQALQGISNQPHEICMQATQSILALAQAYDDLFSLRRVPAFMPYFVVIAGLFGLSMEDSGFGMAFVHLRTDVSSSQSQMLESRCKGNDVRGKIDYSGHCPYVQISAVSHARLLLDKMSLSNPVAAVAERQLREALLGRKGQDFRFGPLRQ